MAEDSKPVSPGSLEEKRQRMKDDHPDIYEFIMAIRQVFGPVMVKVKLGERYEHAQSHQRFL